MLPILISETTASMFTFYHNGSLYEGIVLPSGLYHLVKYFSLEKRDSAFEAAIELGSRGIATIMTVSPHRYGVWADLRDQSPSGGIPLPQDADPTVGGDRGGDDRVETVLPTIEPDAEIAGNFNII